MSTTFKMSQHLRHPVRSASSNVGVAPVISAGRAKSSGLLSSSTSTPYKSPYARTSLTPTYNNRPRLKAPAAHRVPATGQSGLVPLSTVVSAALRNVLSAVSRGSRTQLRQSAEHLDPTSSIAYTEGEDVASQAGPSTGTSLVQTSGLELLELGSQTDPGDLLSCETQTPRLELRCEGMNTETAVGLCSGVQTEEDEGVNEAGRLQLLEEQLKHAVKVIGAMNREYLDLLDINDGLGLELENTKTKLTARTNDLNTFIEVSSPFQIQQTPTPTTVDLKFDHH
jgi:hypothetical protein